MRCTAAAVALLLLPAAGCGWGDAGGGSGGDGRTLTVLAASSLTDVFADLAADFEAEHDVEVDLVLGSSTDLAQQGADGAPGDVLATADPEAMAIAEEAGVVDNVRGFAANRLVLVTTPDADVRGVADLAEVPWVRCAEEVPCGRTAIALLDDLGITADPVSLEDDVRSVLDKVVSGEATAGLVYATDARAAGDAVHTIRIPGAGDHRASYRIATLDQAEHADLALAWVELLTSEPGRAALGDAGFVMP